MQNAKKTEFYSLLQHDVTIFEFVENSCVNGLCFFDINKFENNWKNKTLLNALGYANEEAIALTANEITEFIKKVTLQIQSKGKKRETVNFTHKQGFKLPFSIEIYPKPLKNNRILVGFTKIETDLAKNNLNDDQINSETKLALKKWNERFELATNAAGIGVWEMNLADYAIIWNDLMYKIYDSNPLEFETPKDLFLARVYPDDIDQLEASIRKTIHTKTDLDEVFRIICKNGTIKWLKTNARIASNENNKPLQLIGITFDITSQKTTELDIKHAKELAEAASKSKSEFLANMSHEIRTPLNGVIGFIDLLLKTKLDQTQTQYMNSVFQSANSLLEIINDILDFSKIEAGKLELFIEEIDLFELGSQVTDIIKFQAHTKGLEVLLKISPKLPQFILVDAIRLRQVLVNLLGNATKFTETGEIELKVEMLKKISNTDSVFRFSVRDTGVGIAVKNQHKIFEAFSQEDATVSRKFGGTGLGLTISNKLLLLMGSKLEVKSELGIGSTFYFDITLSSKQGKLIDWKLLNEINNILIVDDNNSNRIVLQQMFALKYVKIDLVKNGIEALEKLNENHDYDLILMDYHMPYLDGIETIKNIRTKIKLNHSSPPVILLQSSTDDEEINAICEELNIQNRLVKPININQLFECLLKIQNKEITADNKKISISKKSTTGLNDIQILVADDNAINMMLTKSIFKSLIPNSVIWEAKNGIEAVSLFVKHKPDIVFMDIQMPEMNGYKASVEIRKLEIDSYVPIIALTAGTVKGEKERCLRAGMDDYISKPIVTKTIEKSITKWLDFSEGIYKKKEKMESNNSNKHFDLDKLRERLDNDDELIAQLLQMTKEYLIDFLPTLEALIVKNDTAAIKSHVHKMKGTALSVCFNYFAVLTIELEAIKTYNDYTFLNLKSKMISEINYLIAMIEEKF